METIISISDVDSKLFDGDFAELFSSENLTEIAKAAKQLGLRIFSWVLSSPIDNL